MPETRLNLLVRVVSALVLLPGVLILTWWGGWGFALLVAGAAAICAWEFAQMSLSREAHAARWTVALAGGLLPVLFHAADPSRGGAVLVAVAPALVVLFFVVNLLAPGRDLTLVPSRVGLSVLGVLYTGGLLACAMLLRDLGPEGFWWVLLLMAVTWGNDTGAYFAGRMFGRHKLYPKVSPGKTWEGFVGGVLASVGAAYLIQAVSTAFRFEHLAPLRLGAVELAVIGLATGVLGPMGDLSESLLKRAFGVKDSGRILPGHGGVLDRIDALLFNAVFLYLWAVLFV